ncbi:MAG: 2Fe-2S iron-sulfur cluster binding domain-containing protein [Deltaproteobacteria bacterium]|nr:2Fe-2S iron-sulfur cluster binding domain-containing protein [Deltaproteobacteria bacterium]
MHFYLNDERVDISHIDPTTTLLRYLRDEAGLRGTKEGCAEGDCGACTVVVLDPARPTNAGASYRAVNSCLLLLPMLHGRRVYTVEGLAEEGAGGAREPHLAQRALMERLGSQCGYCTPGVVMSLVEAAHRSDLDEPWQVDDQLCGNLCRCTGYRPILAAAEAVAGARPEGRLARGLSLWGGAGAAEEARGDAEVHRAAGAGRALAAPSSLEALWAEWAREPQALLVMGGTDLSLMITKRFERPARLISLELLPELRGSEVETLPSGERRWWIGATEALSDVERLARDLCPSLERMLRFFGARQIKNRGTLGGNLCTASPIGDTPPALLALGASVELRSAAGARLLPLEELFVSYRRTALRPQELLARVCVPLPAPAAPGEETRHDRAYKVSKRQELDISAVSAAFSVTLSRPLAPAAGGAGGAPPVVVAARLAYGGVAAIPTRARAAEGALVGALWSEEALERAVAALAQDFTPISDHRGSAWYRATVAGNLLRGFWHEVSAGAPARLPYRPTAAVSL